LVLLPGSVVFIAGDAFTRSWDWRTASIDSHQELTKGNEGHRSASKEAFERDRSWRASAGKRNEKK
jgi:hypothetical protein